MNIEFSYSVASDCSGCCSNEGLEDGYQCEHIFDPHPDFMRGNLRQKPEDLVTLQDEQKAVTIRMRCLYTKFPI